MDFQELKNIIQRDGGKIIIVENDKPQLVVMSFEEYRAKIKGQPIQRAAELPQSPASPAGRPKGIAADPPDLSDREIDGLTIDDLPI